MSLTIPEVGLNIQTKIMHDAMSRHDRRDIKDRPVNGPSFDVHIEQEGQTEGHDRRKRELDSRVVESVEQGRPEQRVMEQVHVVSEPDDFAAPTPLKLVKL